MGCGSCGSRKGRKTYVHEAPNGKKTAYSTESEAKAAAIRKGGTVKTE